MMEETSEKSAAEKKPSAEPNKGKTYRNLLVVTAIYLVAFYAVTMTTTTCPTEFIADIRWLRYPRCTTFGPNELGDTLAGAFAPLAFLWLAGAVYIQSQELREQRRELTETRDVMKAQLALTEEQVKETRASTGYFAEQTAILKRQQELREQEIADEEFDSLAITLLRQQSTDPLRLIHNIEIVTAVDQKPRDAQTEPTNSIPIEPPVGKQWKYTNTGSASVFPPVLGDFETFCRENWNYKFLKLHKIQKPLLLIPRPDGLATIEFINRVKQDLQNLTALTDRVSRPKMHRINALRIDRVIENLQSRTEEIQIAIQIREQFISAGWQPPIG